MRTWKDVNQYATSLFHFWSEGRYVRHAAAMMHVMFPAAIVMIRTMARN